MNQDNDAEIYMDCKAEIQKLRGKLKATSALIEKLGEALSERKVFTTPESLLAYDMYQIWKKENQ